MTYVVTYIDIQRHAAEQAISALKQYMPATLRPERSLETTALREIFRPNRFVVVEAWKNESLFQAHNAAASTLQFRSILKEIHNSPEDQRVHQGFAVDPTLAPMASGALYAVTHVDVPPPRREETERLLRIQAEHARKDPGNVRYDVFQQLAPRTNHFTVVAVWNDDNAFALHELEPHAREFREALGPMLGAPYDERLFNRL